MSGKLYVYVLLCLLSFAAAPALAAPADCSDHYDAAAKKAVATFLKAKYGDAYKDFDLDWPSMVDLSSGDEPDKPVPDNLVSLGFSVRANPQTIKPNTQIVVSFERCTNKVVESIELTRFDKSQKPKK